MNQDLEALIKAYIAAQECPGDQKSRFRQAFEELIGRGLPAQPKRLPERFFASLAPADARLGPRPKPPVCNSAQGVAQPGKSALG